MNYVNKKFDNLQENILSFDMIRFETTKVFKNN